MEEAQKKSNAESTEIENEAMTEEEKIKPEVENVKPKIVKKSKLPEKHSHAPVFRAAPSRKNRYNANVTPDITDMNNDEK